jgi:hypothetical protein
MKDLIAYMARNLVEDGSAVRVEESVVEKTRVYSLRVAESDRGKIIGKQGRTIRALRVVVGAAALRQNERVTLEVAD